MMNSEYATVIKSCTHRAVSGELNFPQIVERLMAIGVERYHADYSRNEVTYYLPDGESLAVELPHPEQPMGDAFDAAAVESAVRQSQRGEHTYIDFVRKTMAAGCVGYFVLIAGRRVDYFGRRGETHVEHFPPAPCI